MSIEEHVARKGSARIDEMPWGRLEWTLSRDQGNSGALTYGRCVLAEDCENGRHIHPNCEEVLMVKVGTIVHTLGDEEVTLEEGDTIRIPAGIAHNARNVGQGIADLLIVFSSGDRHTIDA